METLKRKFPIFKTDPKLAKFFSASLAVFVFGFLLFSFTYLLPDTKIARAEGTKSSVPNKSILEVHLANNGMVYLRGAKVESISGTTLTVSTSWNAVKMLWTVRTDESYYGKRHFGTNFLDSKGKTFALADLRQGNVVNISGTLDPTHATPTVKADAVRIPR